MAGDKVSMTFQVQEDAVRMLDHAAEKYRLKERDKALRCLMDYLAKDADWDEIFGVMRCVRCGDKAGWTEPGS